MLFALFSLILPIFSAPVPVPEEVVELDKRSALAGSGRGTWYEPGLGSCGQTNNRNQLVVALSESIMNKAADCGKSVQITSNGKTANALVVDSCPGCGSGDLDMSPALFQHFASLGQGVIHINWHQA